MNVIVLTERWPLGFALTLSLGVPVEQNSKFIKYSTFKSGKEQLVSLYSATITNSSWLHMHTHLLHGHSTAHHTPVGHSLITHLPHHIHSLYGYSSHHYSLHTHSSHITLAHCMVTHYITSLYLFAHLNY